MYDRTVLYCSSCKHFCSHFPKSLPKLSMTLFSDECKGGREGGGEGALFLWEKIRTRVV